MAPPYISYKEITDHQQYNALVDAIAALEAGAAHLSGNWTKTTKDPDVIYTSGSLRAVLVWDVQLIAQDGGEAGAFIESGVDSPPNVEEAGADFLNPNAAYEFITATITGFIQPNRYYRARKFTAGTATVNSRYLFLIEF